MGKSCVDFTLRQILMRGGAGMKVYDELSEEVVKQKNWSADELRAMGYQYYLRKKEVTMARQLPASEAPKKIRTRDGQELIAKAGYIICYKPGEKVRSKLDSYEHWPVEPAIFSKTYERWEETDWEPSAAENQLIKLGCRPYYKAAGVWAKQLAEDALLQSKEHHHPVLVKTGTYVAVGSEGEPYAMGSSTFHSRYEKPHRVTLVERLRKLLGMR